MRKPAKIGSKLTTIYGQIGTRRMFRWRQMLDGRGLTIMPEQIETACDKKLIGGSTSSFWQVNPGQFRGDDHTTLILIQ